MIHKIEKVSGVSTNDFSDICGATETTTKYIAYLDIENKGSNAHTFQFSMRLMGRDPQEREGESCAENSSLETKPTELKVNPEARDTYSAILEVDPDRTLDDCCLFEEAKEDAQTQHGKPVNFISVNGAELSSTDIEVTWDKWLENPAYTEDL